ncbi:SusC/RagA family TonB-linked outer membrane protein [Chondrinema litorale]|uniref:SusC/RagA family TonB-linked outer membrane protein n=1 Tax=Chondrinema litorale TaxID=2994555 RepID=UPI002543A466|nr:SusC/RagA family TonB-linked outer membrane protein [Chondrinema litorale]UZR97554.1 SusC/RagA family TonB-linked outer membrane protein [Chondrinema litorale]
MLLANEGMSQQSIHKIKLSIAFEDQNMGEVFETLHDKTGFYFTYNHNEFNENLTVSNSFRDESLGEILGYFSQKMNLAFKRINNNIYVKSVRKSSEKVVEEEIIPIQNVITGQVFSAEDSEPLPGVSILIKGTSSGTTTDIDGKYSLNVTNDAVLQFSYIGYETQEVTVGTQTSINISMEPDMEQLEEVVVIGYGTAQKKNVIGAVDKIESKSLEGRAAGTLSEALQGTSANLIIQQPNSEPGAGVNINIRGISTMNNNSPLVVIDGLIGGDMSLLNPADIESISILKDAGSAAIYGSRSANGVILITTKKGKKNTKPTVSFQSQVGVNSPQLLYEPVKGYENAILRNQALVNGGSAPIYSPDEIRQMYEQGDNEWFLESILKDALRQSYNVSITGGNESTTYMVSGGYLDQESNFVGADYGFKRYNLRMNMTNEIGRLKLTSILAYTRSGIKTHTSQTGTLIVDAGRIPPYYFYSMKEDGKYLTNDVLTEFNPLGILEKGGLRESDNDNIFGNLSAEFKIIDGLKIRGVFGGDLKANHTLMKVKQVDYYSSVSATSPSSTSGSDRSTHDDNEKILNLNTQLMLDYDNYIGNDHHIGGLIGVSNESYTRESNGIRLKYTDPDLNTPITETVIETGTYATPQGTTESSLYSMFGRANYSFRDKYLIEFSFRYDGSSKFSKDNRWGFFPSASASWRLTEENFMSGYRERVGNLKLRGSYGILGNQNVADYQYQTTYNIFTNAYGFNNGAVAGTSFTFANEDLRWEKSATFNAGIDATFLDDKLTVTLDYFNKLTSDILIPPAVPGTYGGAVPNYNAGKMRNQGWEATLGYRTMGEVVDHSFSFNIGDSWNEVVYFEGGEQINSSDQMQRIIREGLPFNSYLGYKRDGYFQNMEEVQNGAKPIGSTVSPGDIRYNDKNNDGVIDDQDRFILGNAFPRYTFGFRYEMAWKNLDFSFLLQGVGQRKMFLRGELVEPFHSNYSYTMYTNQLDFWTPINPDAEYPRLAAPGSASNSNNYGKSSDLYLFDASYIRLKNIQLGYTFPTPWMDKIGVKSLRFYVNAQNLFTLSNITFIDPESTEFDGNMSSGGANSGRSYPTLRYYGCGLNVNF